MAVSAISSTSSYQQTSPQAQFRQDFSQLAKSIQSGDLSGAQQAFASLTQLQGNGQGPGSNPNSPIGQALSQIGQALRNGDISGAQQALQSLAQQAPGAHHGHHGHHGHAKPSGDANASASSTPPAPPSSNGSTTVGITVNLSA